MGLFSKKSSKSKAPSYPSGSNQQQQQHFAPPPGPPPPHPQSANYAQPQSYQPSPQQQQQQWQQPHQQQQQGFYAPPSHVPPPQQGYQPPTGGREDPLQALKKYDTVFLVDDSGSMEMFWEDQLAPALASVIQTAIRYDDDGVDIYFFNSREQATSRSAPELLQLFQRVWPTKSTPTASALKRVLDPYVSNLENWVVEGKPSGFPRPKPMNLIVLTDGAPDRGESPEEVIVSMAKRLDAIRMPPYQLGIQFVQIGTDEEAADALRALDDDLREKYMIGRDMVDTTLFEVEGGQLNSEYLMKALLGGMNKTYDNQN